jgi:hypothetical protein
MSARACISDNKGVFALIGIEAVTAAVSSTVSALTGADSLDLMTLESDSAMTDSVFGISFLFIMLSILGTSFCFCFFFSSSSCLASSVSSRSSRMSYINENNNRDTMIECQR